MKIAKLLSLILFIVISSCSDDDSVIDDRKALAQQKIDASLSKFPGISLTVKSDSENYTLVAGNAVIGSRPMDVSALHYMQSISKSFTAVAVLKLKEEGKLNLDAPISTYLPSGICNNLANGNSITVRQLLNMTSGLPDYLDNEQFLPDVISGALPMSSEQVLSYVYGRPAVFSPGTSFGYSNINYHLLALIIDSVTVSGHRAYITTNVINAAGLTHTYYIAGSEDVSAPSGTTASYLANGTAFADVSDLQLGTVETFIGDDGIVASTQDIAKFYHKLLRDETILSASSLAAMKTAVNYQGAPVYGLGLHFDTISGNQAIGHEGSGAGAGSYAFYFPAAKTTIVLCTNVGTLTDDVKEQQFNALWQELVGILLN